MSLLPLDTWRQIIGYNPWHFWQWANPIVPVTSACNTVVFQHGWQYADQGGRQDIIEAIELAEDRVSSEDALGFDPAPKYHVETHEVPKYYDLNLDRIGYVQADGRWLTQIMKYGKIQSVGIETRTLIGTADLTYSDDDGDGLEENWVATIATTVTNTDQIAVYVSAAYRVDDEGISETGDKYRIQPVRVSISGGVATIRGKAWIMAKPILYEGVNPLILDPSDATNFLPEVEVYWKYIDPTGTTVDTSQGKLIWWTRPHPYLCLCSSCGSTTPNIQNSLDPAAVGYAIARIGINDEDLGIVYFAEGQYNTVTGQWCSINWRNCRPPDQIEVRYFAGEPLVNGQMNSRYQKVVARYAAADMPRRICACDDANKELHHWQFDIARSAGMNDEAYGAVSDIDINNPFGTRRGHIYAWKEVRNLRKLIGTSY